MHSISHFKVNILRQAKQQIRNLLSLELITHLSHRTVVRRSHHEDGGCWGKELVEATEAGQRRVEGLDVLKKLQKLIY